MLRYSNKLLVKGNLVKPIVYMINLDSSIDRYEKSKRELEQQNISFEKISAILGSALTQDELNEHYSSALNATHYHCALTPAQIGCYLSHRKAWRKIADGNAAFGIVIEDDFNLVGDLGSAIKTIQNLDINWELIKLAAYQSRKRRIAFSHQLKNEFSIVVHKKPMSGGAATAITKGAAQKLLAATEKFGRPVDTDIQHFWEKGVEILSLLPYPIAQDMDFESTISAKKVKRKKHFWKRKLQQLQASITNNAKVKEQINRLKKEL